MFATNAIRNPQNLPKAEASIKDELARTVKDGFTADGVALAKKSWLESQVVNRSQDQGLNRPSALTVVKAGDFKKAGVLQ